eukprot:gene4778-5405_t
MGHVIQFSCERVSSVDRCPTETGFLMRKMTGYIIAVVTSDAEEENLTCEQSAFVCVTSKRFVAQFYATCAYHMLVMLFAGNFGLQSALIVWNSSPMGTCTSTISPEGTEVKASNKSDGKGCKCCNRESGTDHPNRPCKEEAKSWSSSFDKLMESPIGRKMFQEFLQTQYSDENLRFWMAADAYQMKSAEERKEDARQVYEDFISTISPCEVSIDAKLRADIEDNLDSGDPDLFSNAKNYIYNLMSLDCFPRFVKSKFYKHLCK